MYALLWFFKVKFPEYSSHEFWVSGESYAGIYVPFLAWHIDKYNEQTVEGGFKFNMTGFIVGNGVTNWKYDGTPAYIEMGFWHGLYSIDLYDKYNQWGCPA